MIKRRVCAPLVALALVLLSFFTFEPAALAESDGMVRVKLTRLGAPSAITLTADCDYFLASDPTVRISAGKQMTVTASDNLLSLSYGHSVVELGTSARLMRAASGHSGVRFTQPELSNRFSGDLGFSASGGVITTVLNIYVENYLCGVVGYEISPSSHIEALKAQAVAARTYALRKKANRSGEAYDLTDTAADQVFKGYNSASEYANVVKAVAETRGWVLYSGNSLAQCYYTASNGGQRESARNAWGTALSYTLVKDDPYDFESASAAVKTASVNKDGTGLNAELRAALAEGMAEQLTARHLSADDTEARVNYIESVTACDSRYPAPSRVYKSLTFQLNVTARSVDGASKTGTVSVSIPTFGGFEDWYGLSINPEDNETVWVSETDKAFVISFRRSGHGVGMSQRGAQNMASAYGKSMAEILEYYYPGTTARQLALTDTTRDARTEADPTARTPIATARLTDKTDLLSAANSAASATATVAAGAVVDVYAVQDDWAAVGSSGKYGFVPTDRLASFALTGATLNRPDSAVYGDVREGTQLLQLPVKQALAIDNIASGSRVPVYAWTDDWAMVESAQGLVGFVPVSVLRLTEASTVAEAPEAEAPEADQVITAPEDLYGQLKRDAMLYAEASGDATPTDTLYQGSVVKVLAYDKDWAMVRTQAGQEGYVPLNSVTALDTAQLNTDGVEGGKIKKVTGTRYLYVKSETAKVYESWSTGSGVAATLKLGDRVRVGAYNSLWACVRTSGGATGYMRVSDLSADNPAAQADTGIVMQECDAVTTRKLTMYAAARAGSDAVGRLPKGAHVRVHAWKGDFAYVEYGGVTGFVRLKYLEKIG